VEKPAYGPKATDRSPNRYGVCLAPTVLFLSNTRGNYGDSNDGFPLQITGPRTTVRSPVIARSVRLTPAAPIVMTPAAPAVVVTAKAGTTVVTVESVRVATPPRVPEVAWAPLRERPGLGLGYASRPQTDQP
jgi:hypothetical protein